MTKRRPSKTEEKYKKFAVEYEIQENGTKAYKAVYGAKLSDQSAAAAASRLLKNVKVQAYRAEIQAESARRNEVTADRITQGILRTTERTEGLSVITDKKGRPEIVTLPEEITVTGVEVETGATVTIKTRQAGAVCKFDSFANLKGWELLGKHLGNYFTENLSIVTDPEKRNAELRQILSSAVARGRASGQIN